MTTSPDEAERMMSELETWWLDRVQEEIKQTVPKAIEYGANSMIEVGRSMLRIAGRTDVTDEEAIEVAVLFYINGKIGRWIDAVAAGKRVSDDTIFDIGIYIKMAQRNRDVGSWPGVMVPEFASESDPTGSRGGPFTGTVIMDGPNAQVVQFPPDVDPQEYRRITDGRQCIVCLGTQYHTPVCPTLIKSKDQN